MATVKKPEPAVQRKTSTGEQAPMAPELGTSVAKKRKRLAKVFKRPLDKTLRATPQVREKYAMPEGEYEQLLIIKQRLSDLGLPVKKSELVRAGLRQLAELDDGTLKDALLKIRLVS